MREKYLLRCPGCGRSFPDHYTLDCPSGCDTLLRTVYRERRLTLRSLPGVFRYKEWLPVEGHLRVDAGPVSYESERLARELGLSNLIITFSGYWPERGAGMETCSFKELEAQPTALRLREKGAGGVIQVSSAGNTGRAFCQVSGLTGTPVVVVVPTAAAGRLWTTVPAENVCLITVDGDYSDSIAFGREVCSLPGIVPEGGAKNVARRDGMGTVVLDGALAAGRLPDYYFQAVGSGTGGIAAWEAAERLVADGRFGSRLTELHLSQNLPFVPMVRAWEAGRRTIVAEDMPDAEASIARVYADVLTNRHPPWGIRGGVRDALLASGGRMYAVGNEDARSAGRLFAETEEIDLDPAAAVAVASLARAVEEDLIDPKKHILLNVTGGGYQRAAEDLDRYPVEPFLNVRADEAFAGDVRGAVLDWISEQGAAIRA
ncbi:cysteate synthase [Methanoculleus sp. 10]|jgi:cysteate synthase|uniref:cysteate synthase n=1 Tax=Methanoculleus sp. 10 TaxID=430615 RepID=UPI001B516DB9|nr:cysteate synthase [Methanoculleus sp. 10]MBP7409990.1 cysteate synthase [Methanoculleus sp.]